MAYTKVSDLLELPISGVNEDNMLLVTDAATSKKLSALNLLNANTGTLELKGDQTTTLLTSDATGLSVDKSVSIAGNLTVDGPITAPSVNAYGGTGFKNLIINGDFSVWQRGVDFTTSTNTFCADRWRGWTNTACNITRIDSGGLKIQSTEDTANNTSYMGIFQRIEHPSLYAGKPFTMSVKVRTNRNDVCLRVSSIVNGPPVSADQLEVWQTLTLTSTFPTHGLVGVITFANGGTNLAVDDYMEIKDFQVELGPVATPFEHRPPGLELSLCQRYFWKGKAIGNGSGSGFTHAQTSGSYEFTVNNFVFPVEMRTIPTITTAVPGTSEGCTHSSYSPTLNGVVQLVNISEDNFRLFDGVITADAELL